MRHFRGVPANGMPEVFFFFFFQDKVGLVVSTGPTS